MAAHLLATATTRKCYNPFFRQQQLKSLHDLIRERCPDIISAIVNDTLVSEAEATSECAITLSIIQEFYHATNPEQELKNEKCVARGENSDVRRRPWGVVYIEPDLGHTPFFAVIAPLCAALVAGNCVLLKLENTLLAVPALLKDLLAKALSPDTFTILSCDLNPEELPLCQQVFQETRVRHPSTSQLASSHSYVLAVVDRTADLERAAKHLVTARFAFGGTSPYAPDLVLVNDFVMKRFCDLVLKYAIPYLTDTSTSIKRSLEVKDYIPEHWTPRILTQGNTGAIIQLTAKSPRNIPLPEKQRQHPPVFAITAITSLDNAIDLIAHATSLQPCLAAYHFGAPSHAQYLSQFIDAEVSFINHIPQRLLLGPAAPSFQPFDLLTRYTPYHFTKPCPAYCSSSTHTTVQEKTESRDFLSGNITSLSKKDQAVLLASAAAEIKERKRPESIAIGFFEQGIFIGLGVYGVPLLACVSAGLFYGVRIGFRYFKGML